MKNIVHLKNPDCFIHSDGRIYTLGHHHNSNKKSFRLLNPKHLDKDGYLKITIRGKSYFIHRLIATAFIENPGNLPIVDHKNRNRQDNRVENLRWVTPKENNYNLTPSDITKEIGVRRVDNKKDYEHRYNKLRRSSMLMMRTPEGAPTRTRALSESEYNIMKPMTQKERFLFYQTIKNYSFLKTLKRRIQYKAVLC